jgi:hypothetical protein
MLLWMLQSLYFRSLFLKCIHVNACTTNSAQFTLPYRSANSHVKAAAAEQKNEQLRAAFSISSDYKPGPHLLWKRESFLEI